MNQRFIQSNLKEAQEELARLLEALSSDGEVSFEDFHSQMAHVYHHLNSAWNGRNISDADWRGYSDKTYQALEKFPADLPLIGSDAYYDLPEYNEAEHPDDEDGKTAAACPP